MAGLDPAIHVLVRLAQMLEDTRTLPDQRHAVKEYIQGLVCRELVSLSHRKGRLSWKAIWCMPTNDDAKVLSRKAQELSPNDRIALVEEVLDSLDRPDAAIERLWTTEAADRLAAYRRGELTARDLKDRRK